MRNQYKLVAVFVMISLAATACAGGARLPAADSGNVLSRAELDAAGSANAYDAVQRLRPTFLRGRGPTSIINSTARTRPVVFVDATEYGEIESLRTFPASRLEEIRFFTGPEAATKFGSTYGAGVILVKMRVQ